MGHIPQATSAGSGHVLPSSTAWGLETPTPSKPAGGGQLTSGKSTYCLPSLTHMLWRRPTTLLITGTHTLRGGKYRAGIPGWRLPRPLPGHGIKGSLRSFLRQGQHPGDQGRKPEVSKLAGENKIRQSSA